MWNLFRLNSKNPHPASVIYEGICTCKKNNIGDTKRNVEILWEEYWDTNNISQPSRHSKSNPTQSNAFQRIQRNPTHTFTWKVLMAALINDRVRKNLEASFISLSRPSLNEEIDSKKLLLFRNRVTW